jgi:hypothetical protein
MVQIRTAAEQLAAEGSQRAGAAQQIEEQVTALQRTLEDYGIGLGNGQVAHGTTKAA